ncbi:DEAD/DEAH box helicase [Micromonospora sp. RV43]|uniref:DEAD/DEAH box helicase n=1 Tax=Micromonospora sp. RV43 TaxID=1661387 RepID=UPI00069EE91C|nr:DEAD/DEAH box helicase [Micromonospora sp. RV43]
MTTHPTIAEPLRPRPEQVQALADLARTFALHDRAQLVMACGTGKTLVGRWHAEAAEAQTTLVLLPSLALLAQTLGEWRRVHRWSFEALVVCSDPTTAAGAAERRSDEGATSEVDAPYWSRVRARVTTSPAVAAKFLGHKIDGRPQVVFSTYHSAPVIVAAQAASGSVFDLAICDEAHRLAGRPREEFRVVLDHRAILARKRLFMTATPTRAEGEDVVSMNDHQLFGPVAHTVSFGQAIEAGLLADYQVLVIAQRDGRAVNRHDPETIPSALLDAVDQHGIQRLLTYHSRVARAEEFAATVDTARTRGGKFIRARHVNGKQPTDERIETLRWLANKHGPDVRVVTNARCLTEGIDVPAVDAVMFADQRSSVVDIIQAVGRVLRPSPGKERGSIIIPVSLPADGDDDTGLALSNFGHVWSVLRGLRAHDQRLAEELDRSVQEATSTGAVSKPSQRVHFLLPEDLDARLVQLRLVQEVGSAWEKFYAAALDWARTNDGDRLPRHVKHLGARIGEWAAGQRQARARGMLSADRVSRLEATPGWYWDREDADWADTYGLLESYARALGTVADRTEGESRFAKALSAGGNRWRLGVWMAMQRQTYREGQLDEQRTRMLEKLPGWSWDGGLRLQDVAMIQGLRLFCEFEKHADVPEDHMEGALPLGRWVWALRRAKLLDRLPPAMYDEIAAATPRDAKGASTFRWEKAETQWRLGYSALRNFTRRTGAANPTGKVTAEDTEEVDGVAVRLGQWAALQRLKHRRGELDAKYVAWLEALPGWQWEVSLTRVEYGEPIDLGGHPHGTAKGIAAKCPCKECLDERRARDREHLAKKRELTDPVPAGPAAHHLARLENAGVKRGQIVAVSRVPLGVIRKIASGEWRELERNHEELLLQVTAEMCQAADNVVGSRGRLISSENERIPSGPTWEILDDLAARGFGNAWVSRELGYTGSLQIRRNTPVSRRIADQIADLAKRVGDLRAPAVGRTRKVPPLDELLADAA